jgi:hypothetical protein
MARSVWSIGHETDFDDFLFAPIVEERSGTVLSVISALARLDLDPWQEAIDLDALPGDSATKRMASLLIAVLPDGPSTNLDPMLTAARLTAFLPRRANPKRAPRKKRLPSDERSTDAANKFRTGTYMYLAFVVFMIAAQYVVASSQEPTQATNSSAQPSEIAAPQVPSPEIGR